MATREDRAIQLQAEARERITRSLCDMVTLAASQAEPHWNRVRSNRELLKDEQPRTKLPWEGACELVIPYVKEAKLALMSHIVPALLDPIPIFHVEGLNTESKAHSDKVEKLLQETVTRVARLRTVFERWFDAAFRDGTSIAHVYWDVRQEPRVMQERTSEQLQDGDTGEVIAENETVRSVKRWLTTYDGPAVDLVPVERFSTFPIANDDIQRAPGVFMRAPMTGADLLQRQLQGHYDADAVQAMRKQAGDADSDQLRSADSALRELGDPDVSEEFYARSFTITQLYYRYAPPESTAPPADWLFTIHEPSNTLLEARPSPWFHGRRPFVAISPYQDTEGFYGDSIASAGAGHVQSFKTTLLRLAVDAMSIGINPPRMVASSLWKKFREWFKNGPGQFLPMPDDFFDRTSPQKVASFDNGGYQPTIAIPLLEVLDREGQMATGVNDTLKGLPNPSATSATEAMQIMESSQKLTALLTEHDATGLAEVGELIFGLLYQFQGNAGPQQLWTELYGEDATDDDGEPIALYDVLAGDYVITSSGIRDTNNRAILAKRAEERFALVVSLSQHPVVGQFVSPQMIYAAAHDALLASGTNNPERYLGVEWVAQAPQMMGGMPGMPQGQEMGLQGPVSPEMLEDGGNAPLMQPPAAGALPPELLQAGPDPGLPAAGGLPYG